MWKQYHFGSFSDYDEYYQVFIIKDSKLPELMAYLEKFPDNSATNTFYDIKNEWLVKDKYHFSDKIMPQLCADGGKIFH